MKKQRITSGIAFSIVGTFIVTLINHFRGADFTWLNTVINLVLFFLVGYFFGKKGTKHKIDL